MPNSTDACLRKEARKIVNAVPRSPEDFAKVAMLRLERAAVRERWERSGLFGGIQEDDIPPDNTSDFREALLAEWMERHGLDHDQAAEILAKTRHCDYPPIRPARSASRALSRDDAIEAMAKRAKRKRSLFHNKDRWSQRGDRVQEEVIDAGNGSVGARQLVSSRAA